MPRCTLAEKVQQRIDDALQMAGLDGWVMGEVPSARLFCQCRGVAHASGGMSVSGQDATWARWTER